MNETKSTYSIAITPMMSDELCQWWNELPYIEREIIILDAYMEKKLK
jgi:hypothetical protein